MIDLSDFDLEELYELQNELNHEIDMREDKLRDRAFEIENNQLESSLEEWREAR